MRVYITSTKFTAALRLAEALTERGVDASVVAFGDSPQTEPLPGDKWVALVPEELPAFCTIPYGKCMRIDVDEATEKQVKLAMGKPKMGTSE